METHIENLIIKTTLEEILKLNNKKYINKTVTKELEETTDKILSHNYFIEDVVKNNIGDLKKFKSLEIILKNPQSLKCELINNMPRDLTEYLVICRVLREVLKRYKDHTDTVTLHQAYRDVTKQILVNYINNNNNNNNNLKPSDKNTKKAIMKFKRDEKIQESIDSDKIENITTESKALKRKKSFHRFFKKLFHF